APAVGTITRSASSPDSSSAALRTRGVVHLLRIGPHVSKHLVDVPVEYAECSSGDCTAHQRQGVHGEERVQLKQRDPMPVDEATHLESLVFPLVLDPRETLCR